MLTTKDLVLLRGAVQFLTDEFLPPDPATRQSYLENLTGESLTAADWQRLQGELRACRLAYVVLEQSRRCLLTSDVWETPAEATALTGATASEIATLLLPLEQRGEQG